MCRCSYVIVSLLLRLVSGCSIVFYDINSIRNDICGIVSMLHFDTTDILKIIFSDY